MRAIGARVHLPVSHPAFLEAFDAALPDPGPKDLRIRVMAVAVNPVDTKIRVSLGNAMADPPRILGWDAAGIVDAVGPEVVGFALGDEVFHAGDLTRPGCNAEFHLVDHRMAAKKPASWSWAECAALPLASITAWELMFDRMGIDPDSRDAGREMLVINGAGGVGSALIPLARRAGLRVVATASRPETRAWCLALGAHDVIDHRTALQPQVEALGIREFPFIANLSDTSAYWDTTTALIAPFGVLGLIVEPHGPLPIGDPLKAKCVRIAWEFMGARSRFGMADLNRQGWILQKIAQDCDAGMFPKIVTRVFDGLTVDHLRTAHDAMERGTAHGKWVLEMAGASIDPPVS
jgi:NADPH2:quinone reductase